MSRSFKINADKTSLIEYKLNSKYSDHVIEENHHFNEIMNITVNEFESDKIIFNV